MSIVYVPISTVPLCDVCGMHAARLLTVTDHNLLPVSVCPACFRRVEISVLELTPRAPKRRGRR